jgi:GH25 family lysozyme M1 (1,4-beta-N-acetylmuramidase)
MRPYRSTRSPLRSLITRVAGGAAAAALSVGALAAPAVAAPAPSGPDVSRWQHGSPLSWAKVKASGQSFAFIKASEGTAYTNPYFASDWSGTRSAGLLHGAYHFARPSVGSAVAQARHFIAVAGKTGSAGDLPPVLDLEQSGGLSPVQLTTWTRQFLTETTRLTGRTPILYTYPYFWRTSMAGTTAFTSYPLWIASYNGAAQPQMPAWPRWTFWQYSSSSTVAGIAGKADMNRFNGTSDQLRQLANIAPPVVKTTPAAVTKVTAKLSASSTVRKGAVTLRGSVTPAVAGQKVYRQGYYSGAWHTWASTSVSKTGAFSFTVRPTVKAVNQYRVFLPATATRKAAVSTTLRLTVR